MIPTITDLSKRAANDTDASIEVVVKGANDANLEDHIASTLDRIVAKYSAHDDVKLNSINNKVDAVTATMERILDKHNYNAGAPRWAERRNSANTQEFSPEGLAEVVDHSGSVNRTIDRMMDNHNFNVRPDTKSNDNYRDILGDYIFHPEELPEFANDWRSNRKKPDIYKYNDKVPQARKSLADKHNPVEEKTTSSKKPSAAFDEDIVEAIHSIESNTAETAQLLTMLVASADDLGIDNLRDTEREIESGNDYIDWSGNRDSRPSRNNSDGLKLEEKEDTLLDKARDLISSGIKLPASLAAMVGIVGTTVEDVEDANRADRRSDSRRAGGLTYAASNSLSDAIKHGESRNGGYDALNGGAKKMRSTTGEKEFGKPLTEMTIRELRDYQIKSGLTAKGGGTGAAGAYQIIPNTMYGLGDKFMDPSTIMGSGQFKWDDKFDKKTQDRMRDWLLQNKAGGRGIDEDDSPAEMVYKLAKEWASIPVPRGMKTKNGIISDGTMSYYGQRVPGSVTADKLIAMIKNNGGVAAVLNDPNLTKKRDRESLKPKDGAVLRVRMPEAKPLADASMATTPKPRGTTALAASSYTAPKKESNSGTVVNNTTVNAPQMAAAAPARKQSKTESEFWNIHRNYYDA